MDDVFAVCVLEPPTDLPCVVELLLQREVLSLFDDRPEIGPGEVFHRDEGNALLLADFIDDRDGVVGKPGSHARFPVESRFRVRHVKGNLLDDLQRDVPLQARVVRPVHDPHAAATEFLENLVFADFLHGHTGLM